MTDDETIAIVQAHKEGKMVQCRLRNSRDMWLNVAPGDPVYWDFATYEHRVAPEPRSNRWSCRIEDEAIVVNTGWEDIRFNRSPGMVVLLDKLVDIHNGSIVTTSGNPRKSREWFVPIGTKITLNSNGTISFDYQAMVGALGEYVKLREVIE